VITIWAWANRKKRNISFFSAIGWNRRVLFPWVCKLRLWDWGQIWNTGWCSTSSCLPVQMQAVTIERKKNGTYCGTSTWYPTRPPRFQPRSSHTRRAELLAAILRGCVTRMFTDFLLKETITYRYVYKLIYKADLTSCWSYRPEWTVAPELSFQNQ
jgi:hypothetical protein